MQLSDKSGVHLDKIQFLIPDQSGANLVFIKIGTNNGAIGIAEVSHPNIREIIPVIAKFFQELQGQVITRQTVLADRLGRAKQTDAVSAVSISALCNALADIFARQMKMGLAEYLAKGYAQEFDSAAQKLKLCATVTLPAALEPDSLTKAARVLRAEGFQSISFQMPTTEIKPLVCEQIKLLQGEFEQIYVRVNQKLNLSDALQIAQKLEAAVVTRFDEPLSAHTHIDDLRVLRDNTAIKIGAGTNLSGEDQFKQVVWQQALDVLLLDAQYCGGVQAACQVTQETQRGLGNLADNVAIVNRGGALALVFAAALCSAFGLETPIICDPNIIRRDRQFFSDLPLEINSGELKLHAAHGTSATLQEEYIKDNGTSWSL